MAKVRARPESGMLYLDFFYRGIRCREQTSLPDTVENRRRVQSLMSRISKEIKQGLFDYAATFPGSPKAARFTAPAEPMANAVQDGMGRTPLPTIEATPDTPTFAELGYPEVNMPGFAGAFVPAKTPQPVVDKLNAEITKIVR